MPQRKFTLTHKDWRLWLVDVSAHSKIRGNFLNPRSKVFSEDGLTKYYTEFHTDEVRDALIIDTSSGLKAGGLLAEYYPEQDCVSNPAIIVSEEGVIASSHVEDSMFWSINLLIQGQKLWEIFPPQYQAILTCYTESRGYIKANRRRSGSCSLDI